MITDLHCHTNFSTDAISTISQMLEAAESRNIDIIAITDHADFAPGDSCVEPEPYMEELNKNAGKKVKLLKGIEVGLQFEHRHAFSEFMKRAKYDFVIGSMHRCLEQDFLEGQFYQNRSVEECWQVYFTETLKAMQSCPDFDSLGHLDIITRYHTMTGQNLHEDLFPYLDPVLEWLIENQKGLEINTSKFHIFSRCHPQPLILKRYRQLGGKIITLGSDAHSAEFVGRNLDKGIEAARSAGFSQFAWFEQRKLRFADF